MKFEKINLLKKDKTILIVPLDWGLGHVTRCIPIIYELISKNYTVILGAEGPIKDLLQYEFPELVILPVSGYHIKYSRFKSWLLFSIFLQIPKIINRIFFENRWLKKVVDTYKIDAVISDNRPGLYHSAVPCIYITHQLTIKAGNIFTEKLLQKIHYFFINKFSVCWVPDNEKEGVIAGQLSHPVKLPKTPVKYIGPLSRFEKNTEEKKYDILFLISGPEPQRTLFEKIILNQLKMYAGKAALVRGLPGIDKKEGVIYSDEYRADIANHLGAIQLSKAIQQSEMVIGRSGFTTVMDLLKLQQKAILIPTPGQTEQEYLATYLEKQQFFMSISQDKFILNEAIKKAVTFNYTSFTPNCMQYKNAIQEFTQTL